METASRTNRTHHVLTSENGARKWPRYCHRHSPHPQVSRRLQSSPASGVVSVKQCEKCWWFDDFWSAADFSKAFQLWILLHTSTLNTSIDSNASIDVCFLVISLVYIRINSEPLHRPAQEMLKSWNSLSWSAVWAPGERTNPSPATQKEAPTLQRSTALERLKCVRAGKTNFAHSQTNKTSNSSDWCTITTIWKMNKGYKGEGLRLCKSLWGKVIYKRMTLCMYVWGAVCISEGGKVISLCVKSQMNKVDVWGCVKLKSYLRKTIWFGTSMF